MCLTAFDVDLEKKHTSNTRSIFSVRRKGTPEKYAHSIFEARCAFCGKINQYSSERDLHNTEGKSADYKLAEMYYAENLALSKKIRELENDNEKLTAKIERVEKERKRLADSLYRMQGEAPYKRGRSNPLSG